MRGSLSAAIQVAGLFLPWALRRRLLSVCLGYEIAPTARIGLSLLLADKLVLKDKALIGHLNYIGRLDLLEMHEEAVIGRYNWISGTSRRENADFLKGHRNRASVLIMGKAALIMNWHLLDCMDSVTMGEFSGLAGFRSKIITHGVDVIRGKLVCAPVVIGAYTMVGSGSTLMKGVNISRCCVVSVDSVVMKSVREPFSLVAGNPALVTRKLPPSAKFFSRTESVIR